MEEKVEVWIQDLYLVCIAWEGKTLRIEMPCPSTAQKLFETLLLGKDVKIG
jgi:hypothetical protein